MRSFSKENTLINFLLFIAALIFFKGSLNAFFSTNAFSFSPALLVFGFLYVAYVFIGGAIKKKDVIVITLFFYLLILGVFGFCISDDRLVFMRQYSIGFLNIFGGILFWSLLKYKSTNLKVLDRKVKALFIFFAVINAIGAILQKYASVNLWGLAHNEIYTDSVLLASGTITSRAVSFISSPQALSLFLGVGFCLLLNYRLHSFVKNLMLIIILFAAILVNSKAFFILLLFFFLYKIFIFDIKLKFSLLGCLVFFLILALMSVLMISFFDSYGRIFDIGKILAQPDRYPTYSIWMGVVNEYVFHFKIIFGYGVGLFARGSQIFLDTSLVYTSTESYFLQVLIEIGCVGLILMLALIFQRVKLFLFRNKSDAALLLSLASVSLFVPTVYGYTLGLVFSYFLVGVSCEASDKLK